MPQVEQLLQLNAADRYIQIYTYLSTAFRDQRRNNDVLDCLIPFLQAGTEQQRVGAELDVAALGQFLQSFGLYIPDFVLEELRGRLVARGVLEWKAGGYFVRRAAAHSQPLVIEQVFDTLEDDMSRFAAERFKRTAPPFSDSWRDALITFLQSETLSFPTSPVSKAAGKRSMTVDTTLAGDPASAEKIIVVAFVDECEGDPDRAGTYDKILAIFSGLLIKDFIVNVQSIADRRQHRGLCVYYDTPLLLRLLGTSGKLLRLATLDMHTALQDLGWKTLYLPTTDREVWRILQGIAESPLNAHPETAEAYIAGDFSRDDIADLPDTYVERLEDDFGIRLAGSEPESRKSWQINEAMLSQMLVAESNYNEQRAKRDASSVARILLLRQGATTKEVGYSKHLFISRNLLLHRVAKRFVQENVEDYEPGIIPPVMTAGQIATLAWLSTAHELEPVKVSRELLVNCYSAIRPNREWIAKFVATFEELAKKNPAAVEKLANRALFLRTTRKLMQEASFNRPSLIDAPKMEGVIQTAREETREAGYRADIDREQTKELEAKLELARQEAVAVRLESDELKEQSEQLRQQANLAIAEARAAVVRAEAAEMSLRLAAQDSEMVANEAASPGGQGRSSSGQNANVAALSMVVLVFVALVALFVLREHWMVAVLVVFIVAMAPVIYTFVRNGAELSGQQMLTAYKVGLSSLPMIGNLLSVGQQKATAPMEPDQSAPAENARPVAPEGRRTRATANSQTLGGSGRGSRKRTQARSNSDNG